MYSAAGCVHCRYFGESLAEKLGSSAPPIGLIHTAWGGSMIEEWSTDEVTAGCKGMELPTPGGNTQVSNATCACASANLKERLQ